MKRTEFFRILDRTGSTNNYAMAKLHAGQGANGMAWFARAQESGKGQRGRQWLSSPDENILLSIILEPPRIFSNRHFLFTMLISNACIEFLRRYTTQNLNIKWPNDIYLNDRKAGGILIENIYRGKTWKWAVVGIGININQKVFPSELKNATSLGVATQLRYDPVALARELHDVIMHSAASAQSNEIQSIALVYNQNLFRVQKQVKLRKNSAVFETTITGVNEHGELLTVDSIPRQFEFGEVEWIL